MKTERFDRMIKRVGNSLKRNTTCSTQRRLKIVNSNLPTPRKVTLNQCVVDAMINPKAGTLK
jgi:hypothetical protein